MTQLPSGSDPAVGDASWRPRLLDTKRDADREFLANLVEHGARKSDESGMRLQLLELMECREPGLRNDHAKLSARVTAHLGDTPIADYGTWVHYPWNKELVQVLPEPEFHEVKTSRNRYKITPEEQALLRRKRIAIAGLSVGHPIALALAMEHCACEYRLADPDTVALSNLNRIPCGLGALGINKAVLAARKMFETDPYLEIRIFPEGVSEATADQFLSEGGQVDLLIEECDDLFMKVLLRERARALRLPTVMQTNDRGMLDIERFDLEPQRPILHGMLGETRAEDLKGLTPREKVPYILKILGEGQVSRRFAASLVEIDQTLVSWPQLATGAMLGGATAADTVRRVLLDELEVSGRYYIDFDDLVSPDSRLKFVPRPAVESHDPSSTRPRDNREPARPSSSRNAELTEADARRIVAAGILAPSGGNSQPWRFVYRGGSHIVCLRDEDRSRSFLDYQQLAAHLAMGAAVENMRLEARSLGFFTEIMPPADHEAGSVCVLRFSRAIEAASSEEQALRGAITARSTNRRLGERKPMQEQDASALRRVVEAGGAKLQLVTDPKSLVEIGKILGEGERFRLFHETLFREMMSELRWSEAEASQTGDGIELGTLELDPSDRAGLSMMRSWEIVRFLKELNVGRGLEDSSRRAVEAASGVALLTMPSNGQQAFFTGGRVLERLWLTATLRGLAIHPMSALPYLFARLERGAGFDAESSRALLELRSRYCRLFDVDSNAGELLLFRIARVGAASVRSKRRPVEDVLMFE